MDFTITSYHETRSVIDFVFIDKVFESAERELLRITQDKHPRSIIRMPNADLIADGHIKGIGGSIPAEWDGSVIDLKVI